MAFEPSYLTHIAIGTLAVLLYWVALGSRKGSPRHRQAGRRFLWATAAVLATVGALLFGGSRTFAAPEVVQFCYLVLCVVTVASTGFLALKRRDSLVRFRGTSFRALGVTAFAAGALLLAIGVHGALLMPAVFSVIGLVFGGAMIRFAWFTPVPHPNWPMIWHLNAMCLLFNAVHGTALAVIWKLLFAPGAGHEVNAIFQVGTMAVALGLRIHFGTRVGAPLRLRARATDMQPLAANATPSSDAVAISS